VVTTGPHRRAIRFQSGERATPQAIEDRLAVAVLRTGRFETNLYINAESMRPMLKDDARNRAET